MISKAHKTIYVHIPKVAGQSIEHLFLNDLGLNWNSRGELLLRKKKTFEKGPFRLAHLRASDYVSFGYIDDKTFKDYFKFSFVRNPYTRLFSMYNYLGYSKIISFSTFVNKVVVQKLKNNHFFFQSQYDYLYNEKKEILVDFIGKLESIEEDIRTVIKAAGIKNTDLPHVNKSKGGLKRGISKLISDPSLIVNLDLNKSESSTIKNSLTSETKEAIQKLYANDFEYLNYVP